MSTAVHMSARNPFDSSPTTKSNTRTMAVLSETGTSPKSNRGDSQVTSPSSTTMGPPQNNSPEVESNGNKDPNGSQLNAAAVGSSQSSKVVQTAFIHKLYSMLEDQTIRHLISWSNTNDSFVMSPSNEFSKVLAQYFKHTNISSFVRQLNMYGFHKVSDVFHTGSPESALWEFRHGNGNFKKGDLSSLREIKRRASRHTLIHRDSFTNPKPGPSQPGTPQDIIPDTDQRVAQLEHMVYDIHARLSRSEDNYTLLSTRTQALTEHLSKCHQWVHGLANTVLSIPGQDAALRSEVSSMQQEVARQLDLLRSLEHPPESLANGGSRPYYPASMALDPPLSPRGYGFSESRRSSIQMSEPPPFAGSRPPVPPIPPQFTSPRRFGSIGGPQSSPGFSRPAPPQPPHPHPLSNVVSPPPPPNLARRHTSADIREHGWPLPNVNNNNEGGSPYASGQSSVHWPPSSPQQTPSAGDQAIRDQLASYDINQPRRESVMAADRDNIPPRVDLPPPSLSGNGNGHDHSPWQPSSKFPRTPFDLHSAPGTRRSSMASNVHSLLNPPDAGDRPDGREDDSHYDDRKRKRME